MKILYTLFALVALTTQITACVPLVAGGTASGAAIIADRRTAGVYVEDQNIELKISHKIGLAAGKDTHINVSSFKGYVLLTGEVPDEKTKEAMENIAKITESVRHVTNELVIGPKSSLSSRANDTYLTSKIKVRFLSENRFQANFVKIITENNVVYLMGLVTKQEAEDAVDIARNTQGVDKVVKVFEYLP